MKYSRHLLNALHEVCSETRDLVAKSLRRDGRDLLGDLLVHLEVKGELRIVLLHDNTCRLLHGLLGRLQVGLTHRAAVELDTFPNLRAGRDHCDYETHHSLQTIYLYFMLT